MPVPQECDGFTRGAWQPVSSSGSGWRCKVSDTVAYAVFTLHSTGAQESDRFYRYTRLLAARTPTLRRPHLGARSTHCRPILWIASRVMNATDGTTESSSLYFFQQPFRCRGHQNQAPSGAGDPLRVWRELDVDGVSPWFRSLGRNKKSVAIDLRQDEGRVYVAPYLVVHAYPRRLQKAREIARSQE